MKQTINQRVEKLEERTEYLFSGAEKDIQILEQKLFDAQADIVRLQQKSENQYIALTNQIASLRKRIYSLEEDKTKRDLEKGNLLTRECPDLWLWAIAFFSAMNLFLTLTK